MSKVIFLRGLPGSGKSEWAKYYLDARPKGTTVLSFDDTLKEYDPVTYDNDYTTAFHKNYKEVTNLLMSRLIALVAADEDVVVDSLNLDYEQVCGMATTLGTLRYVYDVQLINFFISVEDSVRRQQRRKGHTVTEEKVKQMDLVLRKVYTCEFPGDVINLRYDTQELITVVTRTNEDDSQYTQAHSGSFAPDKSMLI